MKQEQVKSINGLVVFRIHGFEISDQVDWLDFVFGDATIVNSAQLSQWIEHSLPEDASKEFELTQCRMHHTYLVIQSGKYPGADADDRDRRLIRRAREIVGLLSFITILVTRAQYSICLDFELFQTSGGSILEYDRSGSYRQREYHTNQQVWVRTPTPAFKLSKDALVALLNRPDYSFAFDCVQNLRRIEVTDFLVTFYLATNSMYPTMQFLGSVAAVEVLVCTHARYDQMIERIKTLLGSSHSDGLLERHGKAYGLMERRHAIAHKGDLCTDDEAFRAIMLATYVGVKYLLVGAEFSSKDTFRAYIDYMSKLRAATTCTAFEADHLQHFEKNLFFDHKNDWIRWQLLSYYSLSEPETSKDYELSFVSCVALLSDLQNVGFEECYASVQSGIVFRDPPFSSVLEARNYYDCNKSKVDDSVHLFKKYHEVAVL